MIMKKVLLVGFQFFIAIATAWAQLPNAGFENWTNQGLYEEPQGWLTNNPLYPYDPPALRDTLMVTEGHAALQLMPGCPTFEFYYCPGYVKTTIALNGQIPTFIRARGVCITGNLGVSGSCEAEVKLKKANGQIVGDIITSLDSVICQTQDCFDDLPALIRELSIPVNPSNVMQADSMELIFSVIPELTPLGGGLALLYLDQLTLDYTTTATNAPIAEKWPLHIAPNPVGNMLRGTLPQAADFSLTLHSLSGEQLLQQTFTHTATFQLDVSALPPGMYLVKIQHAHTRAIAQARVVKAE